MAGEPSMSTSTTLRFMVIAGTAALVLAGCGSSNPFRDRSDLVATPSACTAKRFDIYFGEGQAQLTDPALQDKLRTPIQKQLAALATTFGPPTVHSVFEAANFVSQGDFYKALRALRPLMKREAEILGANVPRPASLRGDIVSEEEEPALSRDAG